MTYDKAFIASNMLKSHEVERVVKNVPVFIEAETYKLNNLSKRILSLGIFIYFSKKSILTVISDCCSILVTSIQY